MEKYIPNYLILSEINNQNKALKLIGLLNHLGYENVSCFLATPSLLILNGLSEDNALQFEFKDYKDGLYVLIDKISINLSKKEYSVAELNIIKKKIDIILNKNIKEDVLKDLGNFIKEELKKHIPVDYTYTVVNHPNSLAIGVKIKHWDDVRYQWEVDKTFKTLVKLDLGPPKSSLYSLVNPSLLQDLVRVQDIFMTSVIYFKNKTNTYGSNN